MSSRRFLMILLALTLSLAGLVAARGESAAESPLPVDSFTDMAVGPFTVRTPHGLPGWEENQLRSSTFEYTYKDEANSREHRLTFAAYDMRVGTFSDDLESAKELNAYVFPGNQGGENAQEEYTLVDGFWARFLSDETTNKQGVKTCTASAYYFRGSGLIRISYTLICKPNDPAKTGVDTLLPLFASCAYDSEKAYLQPEDAQLLLTAKNDPKALLPGKSLTFTASFVNTAKVNAKNENNLIVWSAALEDGSPLPEEITLSQKGVLEVKKGYTGQANVVVTAKATRLGTQAVYPISVQPAAKKISLSPAKVYVYLDDETGATVNVSIDPDAVPAASLTWKPARKGIVSIEQNEDGAVTIKALQAGSVEVTARDIGGKSATVAVKAGPAVTNVEIKATGKPIPGGKVTLTATVSPVKAVYKAVSWNLDVSEDIATITDKGVLSIRKDAPEGTVITVIVTAYGAPRPITATLPITVVDK